MDGLDIKASLVSSVREKELKAFDDSKSGVKGLVDAGILNVPEMFIRPPDKLSEEVDYSRTHLQVPVIDFQGIENSDRRKQIVSQVQHASEHWGFFQVVNHGIPLSVLEGMIDGVRLFHEHDFEAKKQLYSLDPKKKVRFFSNYDLYKSQAANWMDTLLLTMLPSDQVTADDLPKSCRSTTMEYKRHILELGDTIIELLSEALGLRANHLKAMDCAKGYHSVAGHYYPPCPQPELTSGVSKHSDSSFFTILLQDHIGGLQVLHGDKWADVEPIAGGLVVNIGDSLQLASEQWGFFHVVNHGIPLSVLDGMIDGVRLFHEQDFEAKKQLYSHDFMKQVRFNNNYDLYQSRAANWRDSLMLTMLPSKSLNADEIPESCRSTSMEYIKHVLALGDTITELLSEALGLKADHLKAMNCARGQNTVGCSYYPACPEPELTMGVSKHTDFSFM